MAIGSHAVPRQDRNLVEAIAVPADSGRRPGRTLAHTRATLENRHSETAQLIAAADGTTYAVPTFAVMEQTLQYGDQLGLSAESLAKVREVSDEACQSLEYLYRSGARVGMGTDLFEERFHARQNREFEFRAGIVPPIDLLRSATSINAEIMQKTGQLGCIAPGALADMIVVDGNPLEDIGLMASPDTAFPVIIKGGVFVRNRL